MLATFELDGVWRLGGACFSTGVMFWRVACVNCHLLKPLRFFDAQAFVPTLGRCCVYVPAYVFVIRTLSFSRAW